MALLWLEGFEGFGTSVGSAVAPTGIVARKYPTFVDNGALQVAAGRLTGYAAHAQLYDQNCYLYTPTFSPADTLIAGIGFKPSSGTGARIFHFYKDTVLGVTLAYNSASGEIDVLFGSGYTLLGTSSGAGLSTSAWSYVELKVKHAAAGTIEVRVNGSTVYTQANVETRPGGSGVANRVRLTFGATGRYPGWYDDFYLLDNSGTRNNDFLGDCKVVAVLPSSDAGTNEWTPSAGSDHFALVDENPCTDDSDYLESAASGQKELWGVGAVSGSGTVAGIMVNTDARKTDATNFSLLTPVKSGATESDDAAQLVSSTSFVTFSRVLETDPNTGQGWTLTSLNAAQFGMKVG